jgi:hypothetical protein
VIHDNNEMLQTILDDRNKILLIKKRFIEELNVKIIELEFKAKKVRQQLRDLKVEIFMSHT